MIVEEEDVKHRQQREHSRSLSSKRESRTFSFTVLLPLEETLYATKIAWRLLGNTYMGDVQELYQMLTETDGLSCSISTIVQIERS